MKMSNIEELNNSYQRNYNSSTYSKRDTLEKPSSYYNCSNYTSQILNSTKVSENDNNISHSQGKAYSQVAENYINELKSLFEQEKQDLLNKLFSAQKEIEYSKSYLRDKINNYENQIREIQTKSEIDYQELEKQYNFQIKKIALEKDEQIELVINKNNELSQCNEELIEKLNKYLDTINTSKINFNNELTNLQCENERLKRENENIRKYYENKLEYCNKNLTDEKNNLIYSYDTTIKELKDGYSLSKENLQKIIEQKEIESKRAYESYENENEKLKALNKEYKTKLTSLTDDNINLLKQCEEQKFEIGNLKKDLEKTKKESKLFFMEKNKFEEQFINLSKEHSNLKNKADKLTRITYGKLFKK